MIHKHALRVLIRVRGSMVSLAPVACWNRGHQRQHQELCAGTACWDLPLVAIALMTVAMMWLPDPGTRVVPGTTQ
eukprot:282441-Lingulodinium_polyedra.AAC.1